MKVRGTRKALLAAFDAVPQDMRTPPFWEMKVILSTKPNYFPTDHLNTEPQMWIDINDEQMAQTVQAMLVANKVSQ